MVQFFMPHSVEGTLNFYYWYIWEVAYGLSIGSEIGDLEQRHDR